MASINGISLKSVRTFRSLEGIGLEANIYYKTKKVGILEDEGNGGPLFVHYTSELSSEVKKVIKKFIADREAEGYKDISNEEDFYNHLFELWETEKTFKSNVKKGYPYTAVFHYIDPKKSLAEVETLKLPVMYGLADESVVKELELEKKPLFVEMYRDLADFAK